MWRNLSLLFILVVLSIQPAFSQDNLKFMHYNLLWFGKYVYDCYQSNNDYEDKTAALKRILDHTQPDVLTVNELDGEGAYPIEEGPEGDGLYLLNNALNVEGTTRYRMAPFDEVYTANALFYNSNKLTLYEHHPVAFQISNSKIFNGYTFYYNASDLASSHDTTFFTVFVVHLKAGRDFEDQQQRDQEVEELMDYIEREEPGRGNYILAGDLNAYGSQEDAYQALTNPPDETYRFYDPVDQPGEWHNNSDYARYHTQSTHSSGECHSGGGMDDRFDFILLSDALMSGSQSMNYIPDSYQAIGQDGSYFDRALNIENNASVSSDIARALYSFSDHLPVSLQLRVSGDPAVELAFDTVYYEPQIPNTEDSVEVLAQVSDTEGEVSRIRALWGEQAGQYPRDTSMLLDGNYYHTMLPPHDPGQTVYFRVKGYDSQDQVILSSREYSYTVDEADAAGPYPGGSSRGFEVVHPVGRQLIIHLDANMRGECLVEIGDITGRTLISKSLNLYGTDRITLPVGSLDPGIYWVRIYDGRTWNVEKFIKN